jgi:hypothetical protein
MSHTSLDIYGLEGQVPESKVKGETVDISTIAEMLGMNGSSSGIQQPSYICQRSNREGIWVLPLLLDLT